MTPALGRALAIAAVVLTAACGSDGDPIAVVEGGSVRGTVTDNTGAAVPNAAVELSGNEQSARATTTGTDGAYTFADVPPGTYTVAVTPPTGFTIGVPAQTSITVASNAEANASAIVLERVVVAGSISGTIIDQNGAAVPYAPVALTGNGQPARTAQTTASGSYRFASVPPGAYALTITVPPGFTLGTTDTATITVESGVQANASAFVLNRLPPDEYFAAVLDAYLKTAAARQQFSGAVLVLRDGVTLFENAYGFADREQGIPNSPATLLRVGSMNKMLTAVAVLQLVQDGQLQLEAPLSTYLPEYPNAELASKVTLHHLLTHTGGTGNIFGPLFDAHRLELREIDDYVDLYGTRGLLFQPGTQWQYSNYGFVLLGAIVERVTGMRYDDYIAAHVLAPAGMTHTGAAPEDSVVPGRSVGYMWQGGTLVSNAATLPYRGGPAGGWYSTVADLARFADAVRELQLLDAAHTTLLIDGKVQVPSDPVMYAYGFIDRVVLGRRWVGHHGGAAGMNGELWFEPEGGYTIVVLSNFDPPAASTIVQFIQGTLPE